MLGSGLTIAGATYCLSFARLPYFQTMGVPVAIGMLVVVAARSRWGRLFFSSAAVSVCSKPSARLRARLWRRVGTAVVRWPAPILAASAVVVLIGMVALPGYTTSYNDRYYLPGSAPANLGYAAADRHFSPARMNPDILMIDADHDMRNPADMLVLDSVAYRVLRIAGSPWCKTSPDPWASRSNTARYHFKTACKAANNQNLPFSESRMADMLKMSMRWAHDRHMERMYALMRQLTAMTHHMVGTTKEMVADHRRITGSYSGFR